MFASVARCTNISTARSGLESGSMGISNKRYEDFDFQQTGCTLQTNRTIKTEDRGSFMLVATILCLKEPRGSCVHFYVESP